MKQKTMVFLLSIISSFLIGGCDNTSAFVDPNLEKHKYTIENLDTYIIELDAKKYNNNVTDSTSNYLYVDNIHHSFMFSSEDKDDASIINPSDIVFEYEGRKLFSFIYDDVWFKHQIDEELISIIDFEEIVLESLENLTKTTVEDKVIYKAVIALEDLVSSGYATLAGSVPEKYYNVTVPVTAVYSQELERFTTFDFDFKPVLEAMNKDLGYFTSNDDYWNVSFEYVRINEEYEIGINDYVLDDYIDYFEAFSIDGIKHLYSFDLINGCVNYSNDRDLMKVEFVDSGLYQLALWAFDGTTDLVVTILDIHQNEIMTFNLNNEDSLTNYWNFAKGSYYILVSSSLSDLSSAHYSLIFMSN